MKYGKMRSVIDLVINMRNENKPEILGHIWERGVATGSIVCTTHELSNGEYIYNISMPEIEK